MKKGMRLKSKRPFKERRKAQRLGIPLQVKYKLLPHKKILHETFCYDISGTGIRLKLDGSLHRGDKLKTFLFFPEDPNPVTALSRVIWCKKTHGKEAKPAFYVGLQYVKIIPKDRERFVHLFCEMMLNYFLSHGEKGKSA